MRFNLNRDFPIENAMHSISFLPWFLRKEPWIGPDCLYLDIYGPQNACIFRMRKW